jgi:hypothetical protein
VARSKRTDRAEARRRYREYLAHIEQEEAQGGELDEDATTRPAARVAEKSPAPRPGQRMGFFPAIKGAMRPVHYVEDLRFTPKLITGSPAIWLPTLIAIACAALAIPRLSGATIESAREDFVIQITVGFALNPYMPMLPALIAGFFAPRASWLAGAIVSFVTTVAYVVTLVAGANGLATDGKALSSTEAVVYAVSLMTLSLPLGALLAAFSAWYKRFLTLTGPAAAMAAQRSGGKQSRRPAARRR